MVNYLFPRYTPHTEVADRFSFQALRVVLPFAAIATVLSAVTFFILRRQGVVDVGWGVLALLLPLTILFIYLLRRALPKVRSPQDIDRLAAMATGATALLMCSGILTSGTSFSPLPVSLLILSSTTLYESNRNFALFAILAISTDAATQVYGGFPFSGLHLLAFILVPTFAALTRLSLNHLQRQVVESRNALQAKLTELKTEKALRSETQAQFQQAQKIEGLGQLATGVAHDFNNYLYVISLMAEDMQIDDPENEKLAIILSSTKGASSICDRMLSYAGRTSSTSETYDLAALTREIRPVIQAAIPKSVSVRFEISDEPLYTDGDPSVISQCLTNLINNSFESINQPGGTIQVSVYCSELSKQLGVGWRRFGDTEPKTDKKPLTSGPVLVLEVSDNGAGMPDTVLDKAFDPYFSTKSVPGHGFGLAITLGIVRSAGGMLLCNSVPGSGTTIQILLPQVSTPLLVPNIDPGDEPVPRSNRLLLVDDEASVRDSAHDLLTKVGYDVTLASSAKSAIDLLSQDTDAFDVILSDQTMPETTGLELLARLRQTGVQTPFVLCSGYARNTIDDFKESQPDAFLHKPFRLSQLEQVLVDLECESTNSSQQRTMHAR